MSLQKGLEQIENSLNPKWNRRHSHKLHKNFRNRWLRRFKGEIPPTKLRKFWEY